MTRDEAQALLEKYESEETKAQQKADAGGHGPVTHGAHVGRRDAFRYAARLLAEALEKSEAADPVAAERARCLAIVTYHAALGGDVFAFIARDIESGDPAPAPFDFSGGDPEPWIVAAEHRMAEERAIEVAP